MVSAQKMRFRGGKSMTAAKYLKTKKRMAKKDGAKCFYDCRGCHLWWVGAISFAACVEIESNNPKLAIEIVENWEKEHPEEAQCRN